jgi:predicted lipoprotein with Yx(FWY)xxD motif
VACLLLVGCGGSPTSGSSPEDSTSPGGASSAPSPSPTSSPAADSPSPGGASRSPTARPSGDPAGTKIITAEHDDFGAMLYDASGQPIYLFDAEATSRPQCYGECAKAWPPVLTEGRPRAEGAVRADLLGTTSRRDGSTQITYAGHPLYFYAHEGKYQVLCHNVDEYGGTWLVVKPNGKPASS